MRQVKKKPHFQIRKMPIKRIIPEKNPQLYALDVQSICRPEKKNASDLYNQNQYEEQFNNQITSSKAYQELYNQYVQVQEQALKQKMQIEKEIEQISNKVDEEKQGCERLTSMKDELHGKIENLRDELTECRDKNYNLRWEVYNQRGTQYANLYGYSFLEPHELTYEELLQMQQQMGSVNRGLTQQQIQQLQNKPYHCQGDQRQICCICYDQIRDGEIVTIFKCKHTHHCECIKDWLVKQRICPICKKQVVVEGKSKSPSSESEIQNPQT